VQIIERACADVEACGGPRTPIKIVNILIGDDLEIEVREEDGNRYSWPSAVDPFEPNAEIIQDEGETVMMVYAEQWLDRLSETYHVYEVAL